MPAKARLLELAKERGLNISARMRKREIEAILAKAAEEGAVADSPASTVELSLSERAMAFFDLKADDMVADLPSPGDGGIKVVSEVTVRLYTTQGIRLYRTTMER